MAKECTHRLRVLIRPHILRRTKAMLTHSCKLQSKNEYIVFCHPSTPQILVTMKLRNQIIHRASIRFNADISKEDLGLISKARKISNHPLLLFWDDAEQKLTFDLTAEGGGEISSKEDFVNLVYDQREKSGKLKILEKLLDEWYTQEDKKNKVLIFSQTKIILDVVSKILQAKDMKYKVSDYNLNY